MWHVKNICGQTRKTSGPMKAGRGFRSAKNIFIFINVLLLMLGIVAVGVSIYVLVTWSETNISCSSTASCSPARPHRFLLQAEAGEMLLNGISVTFLACLGLSAILREQRKSLAVYSGLLIVLGLIQLGAAGILIGTCSMPTGKCWSTIGSWFQKSVTVISGIIGTSFLTEMCGVACSCRLYRSWRTDEWT